MIGAGLLSGIILIEIILRVFPALTFDNMVAWQHTISARPILMKSAVFGHELIPDYKEYTNSLAMWDKEYSVSKPVGTFRILLLGDSTTQSCRWHQLVEKMLNKHDKIEILNAAVIAWGFEHYYRYVQQKTQELDADMLLIAFCLNDLKDIPTPVIIYDKKNEITFYTLFNNDNISDHELSLKINPALFRFSYIYRWYSSEYLARSSNNSPSALKDHSRKLQEMKDIMHDKILAVIFPYLKPFEEYTEDEINEYVKLTQLLDGQRIEYLDLHDHFMRYDRKTLISFRTSDNDYIHFNNRANLLKAEIIFKWLDSKLHKYIR